MLATSFISLPALLIVPQVLMAGGGMAEIPKSYRAGNIKQVQIVENGAWSSSLSSSEESRELCSKFRLTEREVVNFFRSAKRIDKTLYNYLPFSRCYATGSITFLSGEKGRWFIDSERRGHLTLDGGQEAFFYGLDAQANVFAEANPRFDDPMNEAMPVLPSTAVMGQIKSITFRKEKFKWAMSEEQKAGKCRFELSETEVRDYFQRAQATTQKALRKVPSSLCHVEGEVTFTDGREGSWMIESGRRGLIQLSTGGTLYFFGKDAKAPAFE
jgi:hypothetical protein